MSDMETLFPGRQVTAGGETLTITPLFFGNVPLATEKLAPVIKAVSSSLGKPDQSIMDIASSWVDLLAAGGEDLLMFLAWYVNKPREWFNTIGMDDGLALLQAVYEENVDFFNRRVLPLLARAPAESPQTGATSSESLFQPGIDEPTSIDTP